MKYTNVTNPYLTIDKADNCEFTQNYKENIYYRRLSSGQVYESNQNGQINCYDVINSTFYKLGGKYGQYSLSGDSYSKCIFVDSNISYSGIDVIDKCVFYGNNNYWDSDKDGGTSSLVVANRDDSFDVNRIFTNKETGNLYVSITQHNYFRPAWNVADKSGIDLYNRFAEKLGGGIVSFDNKDEFDYITGNVDTNKYICGTKKTEKLINITIMIIQNFLRIFLLQMKTIHHMGI